ncbi:MAG TPA: CUAEP/CCAEP-tail radical SAM protein [Blastocatellia bacterium]|nr:CUAEP/CCAEP-tail radical SAM protein [Blastocatellia bacterium]
MKQASGVLLVSCYELGHQPAGLTRPLGFLSDAGFHATSIDLAVEAFDELKAADARFVGVSVPMHTALRLGVEIAGRVRQINPDCHICFFGLYALLNSSYLLDHVADSVIAGEVEDVLVHLVTAVQRGTPLHKIEIDGVGTRTRLPEPTLERLSSVAPRRDSLPPLERYARLVVDGEERLAGYVEASRGCLHMCTHCPIPPVYGGRFFVTPAEFVIEDLRGQVEAGARHITFGDADFLNGPGHSLRILRAMHEAFPHLTFDFTAKVEHILKHRPIFPELASLGCLFVISAVESLSDTVLSRLDKGHSRADVYEALAIVREAGIALRPSFVAFTPWTTLDDYIDLLEFVDSQKLIDYVDPVQYSIRLLVPPRSLLLSAPDAGEWVGPLIQESFTYEWRHRDFRVDELQRQVSAIVEQAATDDEDPFITFYRIRDVAYAVKGDVQTVRPRPVPRADRLRPPRMTESWFCCAEPTGIQLGSVKAPVQLRRGVSRD